MGMSGTAGFFEKIGFPVPMVVGLFIMALELFGGVLLILGLLTRYVALLFMVEFIVAAYVKWNLMAQGFSGARIDLVILAAAILFATNGAGSLSIDAKIGRG
jgi:putative oxidoreductase